MKNRYQLFSRLLFLIFLVLFISGCSYTHSSQEMPSDTVTDSYNYIVTDGDYELYYVTREKGIINPHDGTVIMDIHTFSSNSVPRPMQDGYIISFYIGNSEHLVLPETASDGIPIIGIGQSAFAHAENLKSIVVPNGYQYIFDHAFLGLSYLNSVRLGPDVDYIESGAIFQGCSELSEIIVDERNSIYMSENNCLLERENMRLIAGGKESNIPDGTLCIGTSAFYDHLAIDEVRIPSSVVKIELLAFVGCETTSFYIGSNVLVIEENAFMRCSDAVIYCAPNEKPTNWNDNWCGSGGKYTPPTVVWGIS